MTLKVEAARLIDDIDLPGSKSHANRYLILAARRGQGTRIEALPDSDDVALLLEALREIGLDISGESEVTFHNSFPACESDTAPLLLDVGEGGTTARFLAAMLTAGKRPYILQTRGRLSERPWEELIEALRAAGAVIEWRGTNLHVQGPLRLAALPGSVSAARSTQFASAIQLAFAQDGHVLTPSDLQTSTPYWRMTEEAIREIQNGQVRVPLDWSSAAYPLVFAAVTEQDITLPNLKPDAQADRILFDVLRERGCARADATGVTLAGKMSRSPLALSVLDCPDLVPALAFLAAHLEGTSRLQGVSVLRHKESDRLAAVLHLLQQCGVKANYESNKDELQVTGRIEGGGPWSLDVPSDHRLVMTAALFCFAHKGGTIPHRQAVRKSFPEFFDLFVNHDHRIP